MYINSKGETLGEIAGDPSLERNIIVIFDENVLNAIQENENFDFSSITEEQSFTLPPYEMRQAIWNEIQNAGYSTDSLGNLIADFEIGGFIQFYNEYKNETQLIGSGYVNRMRITGNKVKDNFSNAGLSQDIDKERDPIAIANNSGKRDLADYGIASYSWHVHLNVFFDDAGIKRSYQWLQRQGQMDTSTSIGKSYSGERTSKPSDPDIKTLNKS